MQINAEKDKFGKSCQLAKIKYSDIQMLQARKAQGRLLLRSGGIWQAECSFVDRDFVRPE